MCFLLHLSGFYSFSRHCISMLTSLKQSLFSLKTKFNAVIRTHLSITPKPRPLETPFVWPRPLSVVFSSGVDAHFAHLWRFRVFLCSWYSWCVVSLSCDCCWIKKRVAFGLRAAGSESLIIRCLCAAMLKHTTQTHGLLLVLFTFFFCHVASGWFQNNAKSKIKQDDSAYMRSSDSLDQSCLCHVSSFDLINAIHTNTRWCFSQYFTFLM